MYRHEIPKSFRENEGHMPSWTKGKWIGAWDFEGKEATYRNRE